MYAIGRKGKCIVTSGRIINEYGELFGYHLDVFNNFKFTKNKYDYEKILDKLVEHANESVVRFGVHFPIEEVGDNFREFIGKYLRECLLSNDYIEIKILDVAGLDIEYDIIEYTPSVFNRKIVGTLYEINLHDYIIEQTIIPLNI